MSDSLDPAELTTLILFFVGFHAIAVPYLIWAVRHRQFARDAEAERVLFGHEKMSVRPAPMPRRARWFFAILLFLFLPTIFLSVWTVCAAAHATEAPTPKKAATLKCPFGG